MYSVSARIVDGRAVSEEIPLPEGKQVTIWVPEDEEEEGVVLTPEEEAALDAAIDDADRTVGISGEEMLRRLRELRERDDAAERP
jgi:hypothetical protein